MPDRPGWTLALIAAVLAAALVRTLAARCDLWLDEIWSLQMALRLSHPLQAAGVLHDNNHILNTAWLATLGPGRGELLYRLPNVIAGVVAVVIAGALVPRAHRAARLVMVLLFASSQLLVTHSSEARGYGPMICLVLLALFALERWLAGARDRWIAPLFWACTVLAMLAHLSAVLGYGALALYWLARRARAEGPRALLVEGVRLHLVPVLALVALYVFFASKMTIGGGYLMSHGDVVLATAALTLGLGDGAQNAALPIAVVAAICALALHELVRARDLRWLLCAAGMALPPLAMVVTGVPHAGPRYLLLSVVFFLLLVGWASRGWIARGGAARTGCLALVGCLLLLNGFGDLELIRLGRGSYRAAVAFMLDRQRSGPVTVTSDHDFRNPKMIGHYARLHPDGARIAYVPAPALAKFGARWLILHRVAGEPGVPPDRVALRGQRYDKRLSLPCAATSGMSWYLFERAPAYAAASAARTPLPPE